MAKTPNSIVTQKIEINPSLIKLRIVPDGWDMPEFTPGQFTLLGLPWTFPRHESADPDYMEPRNPDRLILRSYSVASSSVNKEYLEFYVGLIRSGLLSPRLFSLKAGDRLFVGPQFQGMFTLSEVPEDFNVILVATGTGVAPYMSMIRTEIAGGLCRRYAVILGACHSSDLGYHDELKAIDSTCPVFDYTPIISRPEEEPVIWTGAVGRVQKLWAEKIVEKAWGFAPTPHNTHVFLCGNPKMIDDMSGVLKEEGYEEHTDRKPGQFHVEKFVS